MKKMFMLLWLAMAIGARAQSVGPNTNNSAGGSASISGNTYEWSVAEMTVVNTYSSSSLILTQGLLQPAMAPAVITKTESINTEVRMYPNPVQNELNIQCEFNKGGKLICMLQDLTGKTILQKEYHLDTGNEKLHLALNGIAVGNYLLVVYYKQQSTFSTATFKISKTL